MIEDYERKTVPPISPDPAEAILFRLNQAGLGRKDLIPLIGSASKVSVTRALFTGLRVTDERRQCVTLLPQPARCFAAPSEKRNHPSR